MWPVSKEFCLFCLFCLFFLFFLGCSYIVLSCLEDCCVVASCLFCAVRSLGTCSSVNFVQVQSVVIFDNEAAAWSCVLHMNGSGCFLKSFSLRTVKLSSRWLEIVVCYRWLKMVVFEIIFIMFASCSQTRQPLIAASIYLLSVT